MTDFTVYADETYGFIVADASTSARSFALVPTNYDWSFAKKAKALAQAKALSGKDVDCHMIETPDRFEAVADTRYGCAW